MVARSGDVAHLDNILDLLQNQLQRRCRCLPGQRRQRFGMAGCLAGFEGQMNEPRLGFPAILLDRIMRQVQDRVT